MGSDDANVGGPGECPGHEWVPADFHAVERAGVDGVGFGILNECRWCDSTWYEPSNLDKFPETGGLDPRLA